MRRATRAITTLSVLACALACGGGGGGSTTIITILNGFPQGFLPQRLTGSNGSGDVAFRTEGDLFAVGGGTSDVTAISRADGTVSTFANDVGGAGNSLLSIVAGTATDARLFAGDGAGRIWAIAANGTSSLLIDTGSDPITGLAIAPVGFSDLAGSLFAASGDGGILRITLSDPPAMTIFTPNPVATRYVDVAFSATTLFALDADGDEIETVSALGAATPLQGGFDAPVGMTVDIIANEIYVADAGDHVLRSLPVAGGTLVDRAEYDFDADAPSGLACDGIGAIAFITDGPFAVRGSALPRVNPASTNFGLVVGGPTVGYGDLEFDRLGAFVLVASDEDDSSPADSMNNFVFGVSRDGSAVTVLASGVGAPGEDLTGAAVDPISQTIYFASELGNVYRRLPDGAVSLLVNVSASAVLGLELAPALPAGQGFDPFNGQLIATTADGHVFAIDPLSPNPPTRITASAIGMRLSDLVFSSLGVLYVVDNRITTSRILRVTSSGVETDLQASTTLLGLADGIEIDEGANRLLVASDKSPSDQLLAVSLSGIPASVTALANISIDDGFRPTGVVYDRLGTAVVRSGDLFTALDAVDVSP